MSRAHDDKQRRPTVYDYTNFGGCYYEISKNFVANGITG